MQKHTTQSSRDTSSAGPDLPASILALLALLAACVLALPALLCGLFFQQLTRGRSWSILLWLLVSMPALLVLYLLATHGLSTRIQAQLGLLGHNTKLYQANLARWDLGGLWNASWPVWLRTSVTVPLVALWAELASSRRGGSAALLRQQEERRRAVQARASRWASRRARKPSRLPDAVAGQMVIGLPLESKEER
jgi:hypothetical protein